MANVNTFKFHINNPGESIEKYIKRKNIELSRKIQPCKKIYLDTKYWILLRDAHIGANVDDNIFRLLHLIENLVEGGFAICPISDTIFSELFKQTDIKSLKATAQIIDDLSKGISILYWEDRLNLEILHFFRSKTMKADSIHSLDELIWTKIAYVLSYALPSFKDVPPDINCAMQKSFFDRMWDISLTDMLAQIYSSNDLCMPEFLDYSRELNEGKFSHNEENNSFEQTFLSELEGILDFCKPLFHSMIVNLSEGKIGSKISVDETYSDIYHAFRKNFITSELPTFRIMAGIHAAVRWDKERKFKSNDLYDFHHACAAIPYYDYFLTEHSLKHLVSCKNLRFDSLFHCKTISDIDIAIHELSQIPPN